MNTIKKSLLAASVLAAFGMGAANAATVMASFDVNQNVDSTNYFGTELTSPSLPHGGYGGGVLYDDGSLSITAFLDLQTLFGTHTNTVTTYTIPSIPGTTATALVTSCMDMPDNTTAACPSVALKPLSTDGISSGAVPDGVGDSFTLVFDGTASGSALTQYSFEITSWTPAAAVPVPAAAWLFGSGLLGLAGAARRRRSAAA